MRKTERMGLVDKVVKSDAEWRAELDDLAYKVLRKHGTERAFTNDNFPKEAGTYSCCLLYTSDAADD